MLELQGTAWKKLATRLITNLDQPNARVFGLWVELSIDRVKSFLLNQKSRYLMTVVTSAEGQ